MASQSQDEHFKNPLVDNGDDRNMLVATAAAKGAGLALVAGGLIAMSGARYSQTYRTLSQPMKYFLLGSGKHLRTQHFRRYPCIQKMLLLTDW